MWESRSAGRHYHLTNSKMKKVHGKKYMEIKKLVDKETYTIDEAVALLKKTSVTKFDSSVEAHLSLGVDPKQADQNIRSTVNLPHGTGKETRVIAFVGDDKIKACKAAGAVDAGTDDLIEKIVGGWLEFDVAIATPDQMKALGKIAKNLGQKGLMPNPKSGTVTLDPEKTIGEIKKGKIEVRVDKFANLHNIFGKVSFSEDQLRDNLKALIKAVMDLKPASAKGTYIKNITVATTMGPGIRLEVNTALVDAKK